MTLPSILLNIAAAAQPADSTKAISNINEGLAALKTQPLNMLLDRIMQYLVQFCIQLTIAILVFYLGKFIIKKIHRFLSRMLLRRAVDPSLTTFLLSLVRIILYFILLVTVIGILGLETSSFLALFASAGVAIGMALSGTLQNFAGGVLILLLKPYKVGDYIETQGYAGTVTEIQIFSTIINTFDNKSIILPNGGLSTGSINNWSREEYRRVEWSVSISYGDSFQVAREYILNMLEEEPEIVRMFIEDDKRDRENAARAADGLPPLPEVINKELIDEDGDGIPDYLQKPPSWWRRILHVRGLNKVAKVVDRANKTVHLEKVNREPTVVLDKMADSSVDIKVRAWTTSAKYWEVYYRINERLYTELPACGISFPFPQLDVHLHDKKS